MKFPFPKNKYTESQAELCPPVPDGQTTDKNGTYISDKDRQFVIKIFDSGRPQDLALALGTLDIAADVIKNQMSRWHQADANRKPSGIIVPVAPEDVRVH